MKPLMRSVILISLFFPLSPGVWSQEEATKTQATPRPVPQKRSALPTPPPPDPPSPSTAAPPSKDVATEPASSEAATAPTSPVLQRGAASTQPGFSLPPKARARLGLTSFEQSVLRAKQLNQSSFEGGLRSAYAPTSSMDPGSPGAALPVSTGMFSSQELEERLRALEAIDPNDSAQALEQFIHALTDLHPEIRAFAAQKLQGAHSDRLIAYILETLQYGSPEQVGFVKSALIELRGGVEEKLLSLLQSSEVGLAEKASAGLALAAMGSPKAARVLAQSVWSDSPELALASAEALYELGAPETEGLWFELIKHVEPTIRAIAMDALTAIGSDAALHSLHDTAIGMDGEDYETQSMALNHMNAWPDLMAFPAMIDVMAQNRAIRPEAAELLRLRTGLSFGNTPLEWRIWYDEYLRRNQGMDLPMTEEFPEDGE